MEFLTFLDCLLGVAARLCLCHGKADAKTAEPLQRRECDERMILFESFMIHLFNAFFVSF